MHIDAAMHIDIAPETERLVREEISSGHFRSADELIKAGVKALREMNAIAAYGAKPKATGEEKAREFVQWAKSHRDTPPLSDEAISRASMNPDRW
jgi:Arc/MetJ-type ribon-helix-helix transcriptional regulator